MENVEERISVTLENQGKKLFGILHKPFGVKHCPTVLLFHGFAGNKCGRHRIYVNFSSALSQLGIASFRLDFRGCGDSEGEITDMTLETEISDAMLALSYLEKLPFVDTSKIGFLGRSLGGTVALMTASRYQKMKSIAVWAPVFHAKQWEEEWKRAQVKLKNAVTADAALRINGQLAGEDFVKQMFEINISKELEKLENIPLLHIHGEKDTMVSIEHADLYQEHRKKVKGHSHFLRMPHADHDFTILEMQREAIEETCKWFKQTL